MLTESPAHPTDLMAQGASFIHKNYEDDLKDKRRLLRRIKSYESSLNCRMNACLKQMKLPTNLDKGISESLTDNEILNETLKPESDDSNNKGSCETQNSSGGSINILPNKHVLVKRRTKVDLQREPYLENEFCCRSANSTPTYSIGREPSFVNPTSNNLESRGTSVVTNEPSSLANSKRPEISSFSSSTISISFKKVRDKKSNSLKSWGSVLGLSLFRSSSGVISSTSSEKPSETKSLILLANACQRNHIRRNAICNPYHIPLSRSSRPSLSQENKNVRIDKLFAFIRINNNRVGIDDEQSSNSK